MQRIVMLVGSFDCEVVSGKIKLPEDWLSGMDGASSVGVVVDECEKCLIITPWSEIARESNADAVATKLRVEEDGWLEIGVEKLASVGISDKAKLVGAIRMIKVYSPEEYERLRVSDVGELDIDGLIAGLYDK